VGTLFVNLSVNAITSSQNNRSYESERPGGAGHMNKGDKFLAKKNKIIVEDWRKLLEGKEEGRN